MTGIARTPVGIKNDDLVGLLENMSGSTLRIVVTAYLPLSS